MPNDRSRSRRSGGLGTLNERLSTVKAPVVASLSRTHWWLFGAVGFHPARAIRTMPVRTERCPCSSAACLSSASLDPPPPINTQQPGVATSLLYSGSQFRGHQKSKGNSYDVEVVLQVGAGSTTRTSWLFNS